MDTEHILRINSALDKLNDKLKQLNNDTVNLVSFHVIFLLPMLVGIISIATCVLLLVVFKLKL